MMTRTLLTICVGISLAACDPEYPQDIMVDTAPVYEGNSARRGGTGKTVIAQELPPDAGTVAMTPDTRPPTPDTLRPDTVPMDTLLTVATDTRATQSPDTMTMDAKPDGPRELPVFQKHDANLNWPQDPKDPEAAPFVKFTASVTECKADRVLARELCPGPNKFVAFVNFPVQCGTCDVVAAEYSGLWQSPSGGPLEMGDISRCSSITRIRWEYGRDMRPESNAFSILPLWYGQNKRNFDRVICLKSLDLCATSCTDSAVDTLGQTGIN